MNRAALTELLDRTLDAFMAHDPSRLPLGPSAAYTENGQRLAFGKGLWATATPGGIGRRAIAAEPEAGQIGFFGALRENSNPIVLALRLKERGGAITEIETVICRGHERIFNPDGMMSPRAAFAEILPETERGAREALIAAGNAYFDGIERSDGKMIPASDDCARVENGTQTTLNKEVGGNPAVPLWGMKVADQIGTGYYAYIEAIRDRRYPLVDRERGLVLGIVCFDHPATMKSVAVKGHGIVPLPAFTQKPSTALIAELFQVRGGKITGIEAVLDFFPYGMKSGWA
jgi:hypothetical protein